MTMDFKGYLSERRRVVDAALGELFPRLEDPSRDIVEAMNYSLFAGGKRLRPILCMAGAEAVGGDPRAVLPVACALELIHTYSLIHDDLPMMDDDALRRGKPTSHRVFGEPLALLAGDGLLTAAFDTMTHLDTTRGISPAALVRVIGLIARAAGYRGMVGGQVVDILYEGKAVDPALVEFIHTRKTGALITVSVSSGAILAGGDELRIDAVTTYGQRIGLAFQIADDILDIEGDGSKMGKPVGSDVEKRKITYPAVLGLERSRAIQRRLIDDALTSLRPMGQGAEPLRQLATYVIERTR